jgi:hypothetical protein
MASPANPLRIVASLFLLSAPALGCLCGSEPLCNDSRAGDAVFIGRVTAVSASEVLHFGFSTRLYQFDVQEWLAGGAGATFQLLSDISRCGYRFEPGRTYLVVASREMPGDWWTRACLGSKPIENAQDDLSAMRAYRDGRPLPPRVYGTVLDYREIVRFDQRPPPFANVPVRLVRDGVTLETACGGTGRFAFDRLEKAEYLLEVGPRDWQGSPVRID